MEQNFKKTWTLSLVQLYLLFPKTRRGQVLPSPNGYYGTGQSFLNLTLSWRRSLSYRNQSIDLLCKSMDWFLYDSVLRHERVKEEHKFYSELEQLSGDIPVQFGHCPQWFFFFWNLFHQRGCKSSMNVGGQNQRCPSKFCYKIFPFYIFWTLPLISRTTLWSLKIPCLHFLHRFGVLRDLVPFVQF